MRQPSQHQLGPPAMLQADVLFVLECTGIASIKCTFNQLTSSTSIHPLLNMGDMSALSRKVKGRRICLNQIEFPTFLWHVLSCTDVYMA